MVLVPEPMGCVPNTGEKLLQPFGNLREEEGTDGSDGRCVARGAASPCACCPGRGHQRHCCGDRGAWGRHGWGQAGLGLAAKQRVWDAGQGLWDAGCGSEMQSRGSGMQSRAGEPGTDTAPGEWLLLEAAVSQGSAAPQGQRAQSSAGSAACLPQ